MSTPQHPQKKKGLSGFAIAGIGCLGLLIVIFLGGGFVVAKFMPQLKEMAEDPSKMVIWALEKNPDIEVIKKDDVKREITYKTKSTGEVVTVSYEDLAQGKMKPDNKEVIPAEEAPAPPQIAPPAPPANP
ncbi:hypothetical protein EI77_02070 [Prosthecobacter fusiformis]|uniref:Uncharacterized protein n=1 Tax=Prosthecobacter fusiformis TaxID=48464 RepID=A0A4R7RYJ5_9BACT|nr:hypothetical protein [Prosthecobacter fusiformis]TDU70952.1 hypothetical protein EI77_02070 [Prosthecobacter fusiformis]